MGSRWRGVALVLLSLGAVVSAHLAFLAFTPTPKPFGDEEVYLRVARKKAQEGNTSLLPGKQDLSRRPRLHTRVYAKLHETGAGRDAWLKRIFRLNIGLLCVLLLSVYGQCRLLGLGRAGQLGTLLVLGFFPWFGFYVHTLWPEILHAAMLAVAMLLLLLYLRSRRWLWLVPAGIVYGYCLFIKGVVNAFLPVLVLFLFFSSARADAADRARVKRWLHAALPVLAFLVPLALVLAPQLVVNHERGAGWRIAANRWQNIELGIRLPTAGDPREMRRRNKRHYIREYMNVPVEKGELELVEREEMARKRTLDFIQEHSTLHLVNRQVRKYGRLWFTKPAFFEFLLKRRWGKPPPDWLVSTRAPARTSWYVLLVVFAVGLWKRGREGPGLALLATFALYYLIALFVAPVKVRFAMQLVPVMCLFGGAALDRVVARSRERLVRLRPATPSGDRAPGPS